MSGRDAFQRLLDDTDVADAAHTEGLRKIGKSGKWWKDQMALDGKDPKAFDAFEKSSEYTKYWNAVGDYYATYS